MVAVAVGWRCQHHGVKEGEGERERQVVNRGSLSGWLPANKQARSKEEGRWSIHPT